MEIQVYLDSGRMFKYEVESPEKAREHHHAIITKGYRHNDGKVFESFPVHRINKVKTTGSISTKYPDIEVGT